MQITIIGCGNMGGALAQRLSPHYNVFLYDRNPEKAQLLQKQGFGKVCKKLSDTLKDSEVVFLAIKPQNLVDAADMIFGEQGSQHPLLISLLAGIPHSRLKHHFPHFKIMRMMPNLAMMHGEGLIGLVGEEKITAKEHEQVSSMCQHLGQVHWLLESKIDAFTALASSGPAFAFAIIEAMIDAGIGLGFTAKNSQELILQMLKGSLLLLEKSDKHPGELKWQVASPAGTTIAGLRRLEELALRGGVIDTFFAAYERAKNIKD